MTMIAQWRCKLCVGLMIATTLGSAPLMFQGRAWAEANVDSPFSWSKGSLIAQGIPPSSLTTQSLSGRWRCNDGGTYYLNQVGNTLWWYGESAEDGAFWTNVLHETIQGNRIVGEWSDVPSGRSLW